MSDIRDDESVLSGSSQQKAGASQKSERSILNSLTSFGFKSKDSGKEESSQIITARGTEEGLVLRIDGRTDWPLILCELEAFLGGRKKFFEGGEIAIEWLDTLPSKEQSEELEKLLQEQYSLSLISRARRRPTLKSLKGGIIQETTPLPQEEAKEKKEVPSFVSESTKELFDFIETPSSDSIHSKISKEFTKPAKGGGDLAQKYISKIAQALGEEFEFEDEANAKVLFGTLRSGQRVETPFSLVVIGDVNPGADLIAGGDIIVVGALKGTAHAGAYDDEAFDKVIVSLQMRPMQLRIGSIISRGNGDVVSGAEVARIDNRRIVVEPFNAKVLGKKSR